METESMEESIEIGTNKHAPNSTIAPKMKCNQN
jgi:hypothetical protein